MCTITLEKDIDKNGIKPMLSNLSDVCFLKAQHIRETWADKQLAKSWDKLGAELSLMIGKAYRMGIE
jgi:hypothetical protein